MELVRLLEELVAAAERAGVRVREEPFERELSDVRRPRGGLCTIRGRLTLLVDANLPLPERIATVAESLGSLDLDHLYLTPLVRDTIETHYARARAAARQAWSRKRSGKR